MQMWVLVKCSFCNMPGVILWAAPLQVSQTGRCVISWDESFCENMRRTWQIQAEQHLVPAHLFGLQIIPGLQLCLMKSRTLKCGRKVNAVNDAARCCAKLTLMWQVTRKWRSGVHPRWQRAKVWSCETRILSLSGWTNHGSTSLLLWCL